MTEDSDTGIRKDGEGRKKRWRRSAGAHSQIVIVANFLMTVMMLVVFAVAGVIYFANSAFNDPGPLDNASNFMVPSGAGVGTIADDLAAKGMISDPRIFRVAARVYMRHETLKAGEYRIEAHASMRQIMDLLRSGKSILYSITFPEGLTVREIFDRLAADDKLSGPLPDPLPPEGSIMPDTYKFTRGTSRQEIVDKMRAADKRVVDRIWSGRDPDLPITSKQEMVVLASIVEKETGQPGERPHVASVFMNRLRKGMRLQSDPTVIYGLFGGEGKPTDRPLYQSDLEKKTPYNTYLVNGLPPTPISNPGRASLEAVANPLKTKDLYFVADGTGGHVFAATLAEHNANVRRWRKIEADRKSGDAAPDEGSQPSGN